MLCAYFQTAFDVLIHCKKLHIVDKTDNNASKGNEKISKLFKLLSSSIARQ